MLAACSSVRPAAPAFQAEVDDFRRRFVIVFTTFSIRTVLRRDGCRSQFSRIRKKPVHTDIHTRAPGRSSNPHQTGFSRNFSRGSGYGSGVLRASTSSVEVGNPASWSESLSCRPGLMAAHTPSFLVWGCTTNSWASFDLGSKPCREYRPRSTSSPPSPWSSNLTFSTVSVTSSPMGNLKTSFHSACCCTPSFRVEVNSVLPTLNWTDNPRYGASASEVISRRVTCR
mmetsp:Transcript_114645/g.199384  ORF Transcript_114645/g.199384 Transcript_114645/m.199384 type:complete len:227 (+) Transcript_114645:2386-3066(+)